MKRTNNLIEEECILILNLARIFLRKQIRLVKALKKDFGIKGAHLYGSDDAKLENTLKSKPDWRYRVEGIGYRFVNIKTNEEITFDYGLFDRFDGFIPRFLKYYIANEIEQGRLDKRYNVFFRYKDVYYATVKKSFPAIFPTKKFNDCINKLIEYKFIEPEKKDTVKKAIKILKQNKRINISAFWGSTENLYLTNKSRQYERKN